MSYSRITDYLHYTFAGWVPGAQLNAEFNQIATAISGSSGTNVAAPTGDPTVDTATVQAALTSVEAGGKIVFPSGVYLLTNQITATIAAGASVTLEGSSATEFRFSAGQGFLITYGDLFSSFHPRDITITTMGNGTGNAGITYTDPNRNANPALAALNDFFNVVIRGADGFGQSNYWTECVSINNVNNFNFNSLQCVSDAHSSGDGVFVQGLPLASGYSVVYNFIACMFNFVRYGIVYGSYIQGITVSAGCNFDGCTAGIYAPASATGLLEQLTVVGCQFECTLAAVWAEHSISGVMLGQNEVIIIGATTGFKINSPSAVITGNNIGSSASLVTGSVGIELTGGGNGYVGGNTCGSLDTGVLIDAGVFNTIVMPSGSSSVNNQVIDNGSNNMIMTISAGGHIWSLFSAGSEILDYGITGSNITVNKNVRMTGHLISSLGELLFLNQISGTDPTTAPGAGNVNLYVVNGTTPGTAAIHAQAGTSTTPVVIADNIGAGFS